jgi:hypothetical protein
MRVVQESPRNFNIVKQIADCFGLTLWPPFVDMAPSSYNLRITILELYRISRCGRFKVSPFQTTPILMLVTVRGIYLAIRSEAMSL